MNFIWIQSELHTCFSELKLNNLIGGGPSWLRVVPLSPARVQRTSALWCRPVSRSLGEGLIRYSSAQARGCAYWMWLAVLALSLAWRHLRLVRLARLVGLDTNEAMLAVARAQVLPTGAHVEWRQGDAIKLPFPDAEFGTVLRQRPGICVASSRGTSGNEAGLGIGSTIGT